MSNNQGFRIEPIVFIEAATLIPGVRSEYLVESDRVKFHFWPSPEFPQGFDSSVEQALRNFSKASFTIEYVPEVDSWYLCIKDLPFQLNAFFVEGILKKIALSVEKHGQG